MKKFFVVLFLFFSAVSHAYDFEVDGLFYDILSTEERTVEVSGQSGSIFIPVMDKVIPNKVAFNGITYFVIGIKKNACLHCQSVVVSDGIKYIQEQAFYRCLESLYIPKSIDTIGESVIELDGGAYTNDTLRIYIEDLSSWLKIDFGSERFTFTVGGAAPWYWDVEASFFRFRDNDLFIVFYLNSSLIREVEIPDTIKEIKAYTFSSFHELSSIVIPNSVTSIGRGAFDDCLSLSSISFPSTLKRIGKTAFMGCINLGAITIPKDIELIDQGAFLECNNLASVEIESSTPPKMEMGFDWHNNVSFGAFDAETVNNASLYVPKGTKSLYQNVEGWKAFKHICDNESCIRFQDLQAKKFSVGLADTDNDEEVIPEELAAVRNITTALRNNSAIRTFNEFQYFKAVEEIPANAFYGCNNLRSIILPEHIKTIGNQAFRGCNSLASIVIPEGVTHIGASAFDGCSSLTSVVIPESAESIDVSAFANCI